MTYVLGATPSVRYVPTPTAERDGFASLFFAYKAAYPAGTSESAFARELCRANGIAYKTADIEAWIEAKGGGRYPFAKSNNPGMYGGPKNVGWGFFREGNVILLPDIPRADGKGPKRPEGPPPAGREDGKAGAQAASSSIAPLVIVGLIGLAIVAARRQKRGPLPAAT